MSAKMDVASEFRASLMKIMPGYEWVVHKSVIPQLVSATGTQSSGFNRLSTLSVERLEHESSVSYEATSSGYGVKAPWLASCKGQTLAQALRNLQDHYEAVARKYECHARALRSGRKGRQP